MVYMGIGSLALLGKIIWDYWAAYSHLIRQRIRVILFGSLSGYAFPAALMLSSGITGGEVAVNYAAFTAFFFPLSLAFAIAKRDLFGIETLDQRLLDEVRARAQEKRSGGDPLPADRRNPFVAGTQPPPPPPPPQPAPSPVETAPEPPVAETTPEPPTQ